MISDSVAQTMTLNVFEFLALVFGVYIFGLIIGYIAARADDWMVRRGYHLQSVHLGKFKIAKRWVK